MFALDSIAEKSRRDGDDFAKFTKHARDAEAKEAWIHHLGLMALEAALQPRAGFFFDVKGGKSGSSGAASVASSSLAYALRTGASRRVAVQDERAVAPGVVEAAKAALAALHAEATRLGSEPEPSRQTEHEMTTAQHVAENEGAAQATFQSDRRKRSREQDKQGQAAPKRPRGETRSTTALGDEPDADDADDN